MQGSWTRVGVSSRGTIASRTCQSCIATRRSGRGYGSATRFSAFSLRLARDQLTDSALSYLYKTSPQAEDLFELTKRCPSLRLRRSVAALTHAQLPQPHSVWTTQARPAHREPDHDDQGALVWLLRRGQWSTPAQFLVNAVLGQPMGQASLFQVRPRFRAPRLLLLTCRTAHLRHRHGRRDQASHKGCWRLS